ncbi:hypothetical protein V2J09_015872 [Rumex salicifolius]
MISKTAKAKLRGELPSVSLGLTPLAARRFSAAQPPHLHFSASLPPFSASVSTSLAGAPVSTTPPALLGLHLPAAQPARLKTAPPSRCALEDEPFGAPDPRSTSIRPPEVGRIFTSLSHLPPSINSLQRRLGLHLPDRCRCSGLRTGSLVMLEELIPSSPFFRHGTSLRVTGKLEKYDVRAASAIIVDGSSTLTIDTEHLTINFRIGSVYQFIGELDILPDDDQAILRARVGRNVDVYPKLKVRSQEQDVRYGGGINPSLPGLKALESLFHGDFSSPAKKESKKPTSKKLEEEEPTPCNLESITPLSASKDENDRGEEDIRPYIRASPIPRPRAVLSSPVNDGMIGSKTKRRTDERTSLMKPRQSDQKCNVTIKSSVNGRPKSGNEASKEATNKSELHKPRQLGTKCNVTLKHPAAERHKNGREDPLNKSVNAACKGGIQDYTYLKEKLEQNAQNKTELCLHLGRVPTTE